ncbi:MAG: hypothetical protein QXY73_04070 [Candidatus Bathyarchaeia archaeon]
MSSIIIDFEPLITIVAGLNYPPHGLLHTFIASIPAGTLTGFILYMVREQVTPYLADLALVDKKDPLKSFILAGVVGWASHVFFDSPLYPEMKSFYPLDFNPMFQPNFHQIIFYVYVLLFLTGILVYPVHLYRILERDSRAAARISVGLVLVGLGAMSIPADTLFHVGLLLIVTGLFMLAHGLKRMMPQLSRRIYFSFIALAVAASLIYLASPYMLGLTLEQHIIGLYRLGSSIIFIGSYILSLAALTILWPALRLLKRNLSDYSLSLSIDLLIAGLILAPLLIPLLIAALSYILIIIKMPHELKCLREKTLA